MRSREVLQRLDRLRHLAEEPPKMILDPTALSLVDLSRHLELWSAYRDGVITDAEEQEFCALWLKCPVVDSRKIRIRLNETVEEQQDRLKWQHAFHVVFHDYAEQHPNIPVPNYWSGLNFYRIDIGSKLFQKYGWVLGEMDCSDIIPPDQWALEDRENLMDLYRRSKPDLGEFPLGFTGSRHAKTRSGKLI